MPLTTREPQNGGVGTGLSSATSDRAGIGAESPASAAARRFSAIRSERSRRARRSAVLAASAASLAGSSPFFLDINPSISRSPSNASLAYRTSPRNTELRSFSTYERVSAAPPSSTGNFSASPRAFISSRFSRITTVDFTSNPDIPIASALASSAADRIVEIGCLMPRFTTEYPLLDRMMSTRFLPMSCTSPLTVASTMVPLPAESVFSMCGSRCATACFITSAEVMKQAVAHLEPHMEKTDSAGKGTIVLATVKGDVHDIGKNLVDIILSNNGYSVVNLGIKQPISTILSAAEDAGADAIGMSGLLVKSTVVMRENLEEMNTRGLAEKFPVLLGGAALTRSYVENDLSAVFRGDVRYARDAFEGLRLMDGLMSKKKGLDPARDAADAAKTAERRARRERSERIAEKRRAATDAEDSTPIPARSDVALDNPVPTPPFWGSRVVKGIPLADYSAMLDERATFMGP